MELQTMSKEELITDSESAWRHGIALIHSAHDDLKKENDELKNRNQELERTINEFQAKHTETIEALKTKNTELLTENEDLFHQLTKVREQVARLKRYESDAIFSSAANISRHSDTNNTTQHGSQSQHHGSQSQQQGSTAQEIPPARRGSLNAAQTYLHNRNRNANQSPPRTLHSSNQINTNESSFSHSHNTKNKTYETYEKPSQTFHATAKFENLMEKVQADGQPKFSTRDNLYKASNSLHDDSTDSWNVISTALDDVAPHNNVMNHMSARHGIRFNPTESHQQPGTSAVDAPTLFQKLRDTISAESLEVLMRNLQRFNDGELDYDSMVTRAEVLLCAPHDGYSNTGEKPNYNLFVAFREFLSAPR